MRLAERLSRAGIRDVVTVEPVSGGLAAVAGIARRENAPPVFVKGFADGPDTDAFISEAEGLTALRVRGGMPTPEVIVANHEVLVLSLLQPRPSSEAFWEQFAHALAHLHTSTIHPRFGWHRDNWLGRRRQVNTWADDGFAFFAERRLLRWLQEPRVRAALEPADRVALERLCERLPELLPVRPACLTHGDLWAQNVLATADARAALIDPAVSYTWAEVDLAHLWITAPPPESRRFFDVYAELTGLDKDWPARMPIVQLRQHLAVVAQFDHDWGAAETIRATLAPFRSGRSDTINASFRGRSEGVAVSSENVPSGVDTTVAHPARRYDYWLGGKDNFAADRASGDAVEAQMPTIRLSVRENRWFMHRAVAFAARQAGIRQFLDIGTGIPTSPNTHQIAQEADPAARVVYVDNDPLVLVHARALLTGTKEGMTSYLEADLREPRKILEHPDLRATLDLAQPVALVLVAVLHFIRDDQGSREIIDTLVDALPDGSLVIASHATLEHLPPEQAEAIVKADGRAHPRSGAELAKLFARPDLQPVAPVMSVSQWWPEEAPQPRPAVEDVACNGLVARVVRGPQQK